MRNLRGAAAAFLLLLAGDSALGIDLDPKGLGACLSALGDVDGDGVPDFAAGTKRGLGTLAVCSGKDGKVLWVARGRDAASVPDQDGDGKTDVAIASGGIEEAHETPEWASLRRGTDGARLGAIAPKGPDVLAIGTEAYTDQVASLGDVDGDGKADLLVLRVARVGRDSLEGEWCSRATALVVSIEGKVVVDLKPRVDTRWREFVVGPAVDLDRDGKLDVFVRTTANQTHLGLSVVSATKGVLVDYKGEIGRSPTVVAVLGDANGDGKEDYLFASVLAARGESEYAGEVRIVSGKDAATTLRTIKGEKKGERLGTSMAALGDLDGDGVPDFAAGAPGVRGPKDATSVGAVRAYSTKTGKVLWTVTGETATGELGTTVAALGDVDGDGACDVAAGAPGVLVPGRVLVISGKTGRTIAAVR